MSKKNKRIYWTTNGDASGWKVVPSREAENAYMTSGHNMSAHISEVCSSAVKEVDQVFDVAHVNFKGPVGPVELRFYFHGGSKTVYIMTAAQSLDQG